MATAKSCAKLKQGKQAAADDPDPAQDNSIQSKLVLLTISFPRLRIIWSSSPHATAQIFAELKLKMPEPDLQAAIAAGADEEEVRPGSPSNPAGEDLLRSLPGIGEKRYRYVMSKVGSVMELCEYDEQKLCELLGKADGRKCYEFLHRSIKRS